MFALMRRNAGTIPALFGDPIVGAGVDELPRTCAPRSRAATCRALDVDYMAAAMAGVGARARGADAGARSAPTSRAPRGSPRSCSSAGSRA